jgi:hypothetical protein
MRVGTTAAENREIGDHRGDLEGAATSATSVTRGRRWQRSADQQQHARTSSVAACRPRAAVSSTSIDGTRLG